jgi:predicted RNase H-like HicB family nuclease
MFYPGLLQDMNNILASNVTVQEEQYFVEAEQLSSVLTAPLSDLAVGRTSYSFIGRVLANWTPVDKGWACYIMELTGYAGKGDTIEQAFEELKLAIHADFQRLDRKRPFEMDEDERAKWLQLSNVIDLLHYKMTTPVETREIGEVSFEMISRPRSIRWISGLKYIIDPHRVPAELMSCRPGQWIEAIVKRDPITHREIEIESIRKISFRIPQESEVKAFWETLPEVKLESTEWAW